MKPEEAIEHLRSVLREVKGTVTGNSESEQKALRIILQALQKTEQVEYPLALPIPTLKPMTGAEATSKEAAKLRGEVASHEALIAKYERQIQLRDAAIVRFVLNENN